MRGWPNQGLSPAFRELPRRGGRQRSAVGGELLFE